MNAISINHITKSFGQHSVLNDISLTIEQGQIFGLIGRNGAGKTTLMNIILGLLKADEGTVEVFGDTVHFGQTGTNHHIGYLPDVPSFYPYMTATEYLALCGEITQIPKKVLAARIDKYLALVGLQNTPKRIGSFSRGMKQRLGIAQALLNEPKIFICDEPTSALDPVGRQDILNILLKIKEQTTVIFSTHQLTDAENICDSIALLHEGKFVLSGEMKAISKEHQKPQLIIQLLTAADADTFQTTYPFAARTDLQFIIDAPDIPALQKEIFEYCLQQKITIQSLSIMQTSLDDLFVEVTK